MEPGEKRGSSAAPERALGLAQRLKRPLEFACANGFAKLSQLKDLEPTVRAIAAEAEGVDLPPKARGLLKDIVRRLAGFDAAGPTKRREAAAQALALVERLEAALTPQPGIDQAITDQAIVDQSVRRQSAARAAERRPRQAPQLSLDSPVTVLKGVGPAMADKLARLDIRTVGDLLYLLPRRYEDLRNVKRIAELTNGEVAVVRGSVLGARLAGGFGRGRRKVFEAVLADDSGTVSLKYFQFGLERLKKLLAPGTRLLVAGEVSEFGGRLQFVHPDVELDRDEKAPARIRAVYPATEGLPQQAIRRLASQALPAASTLPCLIPAEIRDRLRLPEPSRAIHSLHAPNESANISALNAFATPAHRALIFEELFFFQLGLEVRRQRRGRQRGIAFAEPERHMRDFAAALPFPLTAAQRRVLAEIARDMNSAHPMNRLIQGDVGCGKTAVALAACFACARAGYQAALMAPTEILAEQHLSTLSGLPSLNLRAVLLTSRLKRAERREALRQLATGEADLAIGTHAVIEGEVEFNRLGLAVVDEQHRFGVMQRSALLAKGRQPDVIVMSATPIPRSLALTIYGDLDLSIIDELPAGRSPIRTRVLTAEQRAEAFSAIRAEVSRGGQAYVVYPLVEESERVALKSATSQLKELKVRLPGMRLGLIHGRIEPGERDATLAAFRRGELDVLVATTVVEVGIDVPNASLMVVEHAERFGLSQLHQLRGRVGRGERAASCLLVTGEEAGEVPKRLAVMEETTDGFRIAEADLELRGPGEFLGVRQSGLPGFRVANILRDARLLTLARQEAAAFIAAGGLARQPELRQELVRRWGERLKLVGVG